MFPIKCQLSLVLCINLSFLTIRAVLLTGPGLIIFKSLSMMVGMVAFAFYQFKGCDPLAAGHIENANQVCATSSMYTIGSLSYI